MTDRVEWFACTVPAGTPVATPVTFPCVFTQGDVTEIDMKIPPGPAGNVGFFISAGGSQYVPRTRGSFIIADNDRITWSVDNAINSGSWSVTAYNLDVWPHTLYFAFLVTELWNASGQDGQPLGQSSNTFSNVLTSQNVTHSATDDPLSLDSLVNSLPPDALLAEAS